jgi:hypothetical protein
MRKLLLFPFLLLITSLSFAQLSFNTGSIELDKELVTLNANAKLDIKEFTINLNASHSIPIPKIKELLNIMDPAEIILSNNIAVIVNKPLDEIVDTYKANKGKSWGQLAKEMGVKPGSPEFHALKGKTKKNNDKTAKAKEKKGKGKNKGKGKGKKH